MISAVLFDMDGLVLDTESYYGRALREAGRKKGIYVTEGFLERTRGVERGMFYDMMREEFGRDFSVGSFRNTYRQLFWEIVEREGIRIKHGFDELIRYLLAEKIPYCLATSSDQETACRLLEAAGYGAVFKVMVCGDSVRRGKPYPDIYLKAAQSLGKKPENCLVLEDSGNGLQAGRRAGCMTCLVPDLGIPGGISENCDLMMKSLLDVRNWLIRKRAEYPCGSRKDPCAG